MYNEVRKVTKGCDQLKRINEFSINQLEKEDRDNHKSRYRLKKSNRIKRAIMAAVLLMIIIGGSAAGTAYYSTNKDISNDSNTINENIQKGIPISENESIETIHTEESASPEIAVTASEVAEDNSIQTQADMADTLRNNDEKEIEHKVKSGDSLYKLSIKYYNSSQFQQFLALYNGLHNSNDLQIGETIMVPYPPPTEWHQEEETSVIVNAKSMKIHEVAPGDTLYKISLQYYRSSEYQDLLAKINGVKDPIALKVGDKIKIPEIH
ncbi:LysM peptidoglycan-binding domain-containing protein [Bacillus sp. Marseille-P3661]|uniref:LysM peptidoglycan-binding domain-containing protein n=1 Tax=Bacillus sp. Marseille-P3661 TaxID=1936234 RepID=UPI000C81BCBC|nr:LysM domain-containing protein [Bacillus sp. Marseille-P3661]